MESFFGSPLRGYESALGALAVTLALVGGCSKESKPEAEGPHAAVQPAAPSKPAEPVAADPAAQPAAAPADDMYDEPNFELSIATVGPVKAGQVSQAQVVLQAKDPFKVNESYPYKFKLKPLEGVTTDKPVFEKDGLKLEKKRAVMSVPFTAQSAGKKTLAGQFSFSVCTDDKCLIEKRELALTVDAE